MVLNLYKKIGETPLERINRLREENPEYKDRVLSYAGRLDPLAEGVLLVLVGDENKEQERHFGEEKEYEVEILLGIESDTYDILGISEADQKLLEVSLNKFKEVCSEFVGSFEIEYPPYSSKPVNGKPLFYWARNNKLDEIEIPKRDIEIQSINVIEGRKIKGKDLYSEVKSKVSLVKGDFRQSEIIKNWDSVVSPERESQVFKVKVSCGSGAYMRSLAHLIGKKLGTKALAYSIKRTRVGEYLLEDSLI